MRVEMQVKIGGFRNGVEWPDKGGVVELPDHEAADLVAAGYAKEAAGEEVPAAPVEAPEPAEDGDEAPAGDGDAPEPAEPVKRPRSRTKKA